MNIGRHYERLKESLEVLDESITKELVSRQRTIGFNCSAAAADLLEIFLHKQNLIEPGFCVKHEWFKSKNKVKEKINFDFQNKDEIIKLMEQIEEKRNDLCYGAPKEEEMIQEVLLNFNKLKQVFISMGVANEK